MILTVSIITLDIKEGRLYVSIRYNDECRNGYNTFGITGEIYASRQSKADHYFISGGCIHDEIRYHFPELAYLIKWHGMTSDGPLYYLENTKYHARSKTHACAIGDAVAWDTKLKFKDIPFTFKEQEPGFWEYLDNVGDFDNISIVEIPYDGGDDDYDFESNYSFTGFINLDAKKKWYATPFKTESDAEEFLQALRTREYEYVKTPIKWCKSVTPDIEAARATAVWPEATLEQLQSREALMARLPALMSEFKVDLKTIGIQ